MLVNITPLTPGIFLLQFPNGSLKPTLEEERDNVEKKKQHGICTMQSDHASNHLPSVTLNESDTFKRGGVLRCE